MSTKVRMRKPGAGRSTEVAAWQEQLARLKDRRRLLTQVILHLEALQADSRNVTPGNFGVHGARPKKPARTSPTSATSLSFPQDIT